jgi:hypothetical protein
MAGGLLAGQVKSGGKTPGLFAKKAIHRAFVVARIEGGQLQTLFQGQHKQLLGRYKGGAGRCEGNRQLDSRNSSHGFGQKKEKEEKENNGGYPK